MPQSGDGDAWPTTDGDKQSEQAGDASTHELPVPEKPAAGSWFEPPSSNGRDEPHAKPAQQRTQPMSWPVADLEKQVKNANTEAMSFVRPVATPAWPNEETSPADAEAGRDWPSEPATAPTAELPAPSDPETDRARPDLTDQESPADPGKQDDPAPNPLGADASVDQAVASPVPVDADHDSHQRTDADRGSGMPPEQPPTGQPPADTTASEQPRAEQPAETTAPDESPSGTPALREPADAGASDQTDNARPAETAVPDHSRAPADDTADSRPGQPPATPEPDASHAASDDPGASARPDAPQPDRAPTGEPGDGTPPDGSRAAEPADAEGSRAGLRADAEGSPAGLPADAEGSRAGLPGDAEGSRAGAPTDAEESERSRSGRSVDDAPDGARGRSVDAAGSDGSGAGRSTDAAGSDRSRSGWFVDDTPDGARDLPADAVPDSPRSGRPSDAVPDGSRAGWPPDAAEPDRSRGSKPADAASPDRSRAGQPADAAEADRSRAGRSADDVPDSPRSGLPADAARAERSRAAWPPDAAPEGTRAGWPPGAGPDRSRTGPPADPGEADRSRAGRPADAAGPDRSRAGHPDRTRAGHPAAGAERPRAGQPSDAPDRPRTGRSGEATVVNLVPPTPPKPPADGPTVFLRPTQPQQPQREQAPDSQPFSFVRPRHETYQAPDSATVNIPRPDRTNEWPPPEPPRAAPQRVDPAPEEPPAPRKNKKLLVVAVAVVAVLGLAAGVVLGVPGLSEKLGLTGEDPVAIEPPPAPISYTPGLRGPEGNAPAPTSQGVESVLAGPLANPALGTITGVVIDPAANETLYERDSANAITPASTGKIITAAAALLSLDHTQQLVTKVVAGEQPGEVIIVGGGDPTISSLKVGNESIYPGAAHLSELVDQVKASGVQVTTVYIDQSRYAPPGLEPSWLPEDVGLGYIAPIVPAMLDGDRRDATINYSPRTNDPGRTLVDEFATRIGASPAASIEKAAPPNAKVLGEIRSAPMSQLVDNMLDGSENTLGDILAHEVAIKAGEEPSFDGASKAMLDILRQNNFDVEGVVLRDGSGMSTENKVSARLLAQILAVAAGPDGKDPRTDKLRPLLGGLPVAGGSGTLEDRYTQGASVEGRGWVRAKTGTLTGVNSLAGIVLDKDNRPLVFAFLTAGTNGNTARPALDAVAAALRGCGCR